MALLCDLRIATEDAVFGLPETTLGMTPAAGGTQTLRRTVGLQKALDLLLLNHRINAKEALSIGLINRVVASHDLMQVAQEVSLGFVNKNPIALQFIKQAVTLGSDLTLQHALDLESTLALKLFLSENRI